MELTWIPYLISILALLLLLEQITYLRKKRFLPGPALVLPFIGNAVSMATEPGRFWEIQSKYAKSSPLGISANYLFGHYVVYVSSTDLSHRIFANIRPDAFHFVAHPFGKKLFGERSMIYTFGQEHRDLRRRILPTFAPKALQTYTDIQQRITARHLACWCKESSEKNMSISLRALFRDMNMETSQKVFVGPYLNEEDRKQFKLDYDIFMAGLTTLPIDLPGFALRSTMLAKERIFQRLSLCVEASEKRMKSGKEPTCLVDFCMQGHLREMEVPGENQSYEFSHSEIGANLFEFFLAKQGASTSSLLWAVSYLESHPLVLEKVREEVARYWMPENDAGIFIKGEKLKEMKYTEAVAREVLRIRPPAIVVAHIAGADFKLTESYTIPKGAIVFPSVFDSSFQGFTQPERFDPDRFMEERQEGKVFKRNFLTFGAGPHVCVGSTYALNHLTLFIAMFAASVDFKRDRTDDCDDIVYVPTMVPRDGCRVFLSIRAN